VLATQTCVRYKSNEDVIRFYLQHCNNKFVFLTQFVQLNFLTDPRADIRRRYQRYTSRTEETELKPVSGCTIPKQVHLCLFNEGLPEDYRLVNTGICSDRQFFEHNGAQQYVVSFYLCPQHKCVAEYQQHANMFRIFYDVAFGVFIE
jgi:hypothetical protein